MPMPKARRLRIDDVAGSMESLTVIDIEITGLEGRLRPGGLIGASGDTICIIDVPCCIIDIKREDVSIYESAANVLEGFMFRLPEQRDSPDAPVYYVREMESPRALELGAGGIKVPGGDVDAQLVGLAGEVFDAETLEREGIATTAPVIELSPGGRRATRE